MIPNDGQTSLTPAMQQFAYFKQRYPDAILFFRMGDFYETFYEDAKICSKVLGLTLTSRNKDDPNPIPLAGVPYHAVDGYLRRMLQAGYKVAICEQVEDPRTAKGVVKRDVVRVVTPGTITEDALLDTGKDNYLAAVHLGQHDTAAISWVDISTGQFFVHRVCQDRIVDELARLAPAECLLADMKGELFDGQQRRLAGQIGQFVGASITYRPMWYFDQRHATERLLRHLGVTTLDGFGIGSQDQDLICPAGAILEYLDETQKTALPHIRTIKRYNPANILQIDPASLRGLEVLQTIRSGSQKGSLLDCLDFTLTGMGKRMLRHWLCEPPAQLQVIVARHDAVCALKEEDRQLNELRQALGQVFDIERIAARICTGRAGPRDLLALGQTLQLVPRLRQALEGLGSRLVQQLRDGCDGIEDLAEILNAAIRPDCPNHLRSGGLIKDGFDPQLDQLRGICRDGDRWLAAYQREQIERTGIQGLKIGFNQVFGYYIEVSRPHADKVPADYHRRQSIKNAERYVTEQLRQYQTRQLTAQQEALELEVQIFERLRKQAATYLPRLQGLANVIAQLDCLQSFAYVAMRRGYTRPQMTDGTELVIRDGKHPVLAEVLGSQFVPNDISLGGGDGELWIITGPNMSGKSTFIRQVALLVLMAQAGSFIPAKEATIGVVDRIFTRVGASDELGRGQSTFMVEMIETANILNNATNRSLVILDEVGRGTSTYDGIALAWAVAEYIASQIRCRTLFATHYHELTELGTLFGNIKNYNVSVREWADQVVFLHRIEPGGTDKSYGIHVARLAGIPQQVIQRARQVLGQLQSRFQDQGVGVARPVDLPSPPAGLFVQANRPILERLRALDIDHLAPIEAINILHQLKQQMVLQ